MTKQYLNGVLVDMTTEEIEKSEKDFIEFQKDTEILNQKIQEKKDAQKTSYDKFIALGFTKLESEILTNYKEPEEE
tara:strand:+ start:550 stop:777 length:228 start_codon:yes stop_codon:yes gene_type:complete